MKKLALTLALAMLIPCFAACGDTPAAPADSTAPADSADSTAPAPETTVDPYLVEDELPELTFDSENIFIYLDNDTQTNARRYHIDKEDLTEGDIVAEAVIDRNNTVETRFDVILEYDYVLTGWRDLSLFRQSVLAGDEYDIFSGVSLYACPLTLYGIFTNLSDNSYIDMEKPWYQEYIIKELALGERQYLSSGFFDFPSMDRSIVLYFNSNMVEDYDLGNLYEIVKNDEWTWDKMIEMCEIVSDDVNSDGVFDENDQYGMVSRWDNWIGAPGGAGYSYTTLGDDGYLTVTGLTDELQTMSEKIYPFITNSNLYWSTYTYGVHPKYDGAREARGMEMFLNDQILFNYAGVGWTSSNQFREFGAYGILPLPKLTDTQKFYGSWTSAFCSAIVNTTGSYKSASIIYEALQAESFKQIRPAYYDTALAFKYVEDPQAFEMIDLVFQNLTSQFAYNYGEVIGMDLNTCISKYESLASFFAAQSGAIDIKLKELIDICNMLPDVKPAD